MTKLTLTLATALSLAAPLFGGGAIAQAPATIRVTMAAPVAQTGPVQAMATRWNCADTLCTGPALNARLGDARACREVAKAVGAVAAYVGTRGELSADDLAKCNKSAKAAG